MSKVSSPFDRYIKAEGEAMQRIIAASYGEVGTRKSSFWFEAPGPIVVFSFDRGTEGVIEQYQELKDIYVKEYEWSPTEELSQNDAVSLRDEFTDDFEHAIMNARTVVIDKENDLWELFRYAEFGAPNDSPRNYPALNQRYRRIINLPKSLDINFGLIQGMKDEWGEKINKKTGARGAASTGRRIRQGFGEIEGLVHINIQHRREREEAEDGTPETHFYIDIGKARGPGSRQVQDQTFGALTFAEFATLVFPDTEESDWGGE